MGQWCIILGLQYPENMDKHEQRVAFVVCVNIRHHLEAPKRFQITVLTTVYSGHPSWRAVLGKYAVKD